LPPTQASGYHPHIPPFLFMPICRVIPMRLGLSLCCLIIVVAIITLPLRSADPPTTGSAKPGETKGLDDALRNLHAPLAGGDPLPAAESLKKLKVQDGLTIELIAAEPAVRQPLHIDFDERGRMWVVNYEQYPFPAGLKIVEYDRYIRAKFDKVPPPPPHQFRGRDRVTIHEDTHGDGNFDKVTTFVDGLNIATSTLHGRGGVWVTNPPYLLFYPDKDDKGVPDGDPVVHLSGFGLEDTHAVMNSLMWGPDGWIYGCQGSTCTARVRVEIEKETKTTDFLGQAIWRYHPETHRFEIFAEGGGNTFGVAFDEQGRLYSGTNWGKYRGLHYVQGGYYVKGWGKHGPLTNPYALGYFEHMPHTGNADRLTHTFIFYGGGALPDRFNGKIIGPNPLQRRISVTREEPVGSSYQTIEEAFLVTSDDRWFRPVDLKAGPDGALYVADLYENRISHVDPRDNWHRESGRIYRIRAIDAKPIAPFDLSKKSSAELVGLLSSPNRWFRETARRLLGDRKDRSVIPQLLSNIESNEGQVALESLWALNLCGGLSDDVAEHTLKHANPMVRAWTVRLLGDRNEVSPRIAADLIAQARSEPDVQVRSQFASTAKRLPPGDGLPIVTTLLQRSIDMADVHIPLLLWWAIEAKAELPAGRQAILGYFTDANFWHLPIVEQTIAERIAQRYAMAGGDENLGSCARLLGAAPDAKSRSLVLSGLEKAFAGRAASVFPDELKNAVAQALREDSSNRHLSLGMRIGHPGAVAAALTIVRDENAPADRRLELMRLLGEVPQSGGSSVLLDVLAKSRSLPIRLAALTALQRYSDSALADSVLRLYAEAWQNEPDLRAAAQTMLSSRPQWAISLLLAVDDGRIAARTIPLDIVRSIKRFPDAEIAKLVTKHWGQVRLATGEEKRSEILRVAAILKTGGGDAKAGKLVFTNTCGKCHKLFGEGASVGPELTGYERDNLRYWLENIVDPSASIRDEYLAFVVNTTDGRSLTGIIAGQDKATVTLKLADSQTVRLAREQIEELRASPISIMPEELLKNLQEQQLRDLFAYLMKKK
jgi:putative membrane-bound dehydrogenase-like protein